MIPAYMLEQVYSNDGKRHLAVLDDGLREGGIHPTTLCGCVSGPPTGRIYPCDCQECLNVYRPES